MKYKMTDKEFLEAGHKYQVGDVVRGEGGTTDVVSGHNIENYNNVDLSHDDWYVVRAAALENEQEKLSNDRLDRYVQAALTGLCSTPEARFRDIPTEAVMLGRETMEAVDNE